MFTPLDINEGDEPEVVDNENDLPYGDILEKKYHFDPIPEEITPSVPEPVEQAPVPPQQEPQQVVQSTPKVPEVVTPIIEEALAEEQLAEEQEIVDDEKEIQELPQEDKVDNSEILQTKFQTDIQKKFGELFMATKKIYALKNLSEEGIDIVGANNDMVFVSYKFLIDEDQNPAVYITKNEQNKQTEEDVQNELRFIFNDAEQSLEVIVNETVLFNEVEDLTEDPKKKMQVIDKLNKFIFLVSEELRKIEKEIKEKEEAEKERRMLQDIFRNF